MFNKMDDFCIMFNPHHLGASDFVGLNNYATRLTRPLQEGEKPRDDIETWLQMSFHVDPEWPM